MIEHAFFIFLGAWLYYAVPLMVKVWRHRKAPPAPRPLSGGQVAARELRHLGKQLDKAGNNRWWKERLDFHADEFDRLRQENARLRTDLRIARDVRWDEDDVVEDDVA